MPRADPGEAARTPLAAERPAAPERASGLPSVKVLPLTSAMTRGAPKRGGATACAAGFDAECCCCPMPTSGDGLKADHVATCGSERSEATPALASGLVTVVDAAPPAAPVGVLGAAPP